MKLKFDKIDKTLLDKINNSDLISRDLSWTQFNYRVLDQAKRTRRNILDRLKFIAITASNLDEFMMIRVGSLYNYLDYDKSRIDYSGLREYDFKKTLLGELASFHGDKEEYLSKTLLPEAEKKGLLIRGLDDLKEDELRKVNFYFNKTVYPMLTPMLYDTFHTFPSLSGKRIIIGAVTNAKKGDSTDKHSFVQIPSNLPPFLEIERGDKFVYVPIEEIVLGNLDKLYKKVHIDSTAVFRITRNGDFDYDTYDESEDTFVEEIQRKLKKRKTGRVVRLEVKQGSSKRIIKLLRKKFEIEKDDTLECTLLDHTRLWFFVKNANLRGLVDTGIKKEPVAPLFNAGDLSPENIFKTLKKQDLVLHHPYNRIDPVLNMLEAAADDPDVLAIKITIYRLADDSRVTAALLKAAESGKNVSVLFEVKARFDEENNITEGRRLEKAGCFVIYGIPKVKTHTKLLMIVRRSGGSDVSRYVHMSSGNYNESTAGLYTDISYMTSERVYGRDVSEFFNVITGHSIPDYYRKLITTPGDMRKKVVSLIRGEVRNKKKGLKAGIIIKVNSLEDKQTIEELYKASKAGVSVKLIVRGICCARAGRKGLSENVEIKSIVGDYLEHSRVYYFHNDGDPKVLSGSADVMVRSFDKRIESLYKVEGTARQQIMAILDYSLRDEANSFIMQEDGSYERVQSESKKPFNVHDAFYTMSEEDVMGVKLF